MALAFTCTARHAAIPALVPGNTLAVSRSEVCAKMTPTILRRLADAIRDKALEMTGPDLDEIEQAVDAEHERLMVRLDAALAARCRAAARHHPAA